MVATRWSTRSFASVLICPSVAVRSRTRRSMSISASASSTQGSTSTFTSLVSVSSLCAAFLRVLLGVAAGLLASTVGASAGGLAPGAATSSSPSVAAGAAVRSFLLSAMLCKFPKERGCRLRSTRGNPRPRIIGSPHSVFFGPSTSSSSGSVGHPPTRSSSGVFFTPSRGTIFGNIPSRRLDFAISRTQTSPGTWGSGEPPGLLRAALCLILEPADHSQTENGATVFRGGGVVKCQARMVAL